MGSNKEDENKKIHDNFASNETENIFDLPSHVYNVETNVGSNRVVASASGAAPPPPPRDIETSGSKLNELMLKSSIETDNKTSDVYTTINDDDPNGTITAPADDITYSNLNDMAISQM